jgi:predicted glycogen debranching enzyme
MSAPRISRKSTPQTQSPEIVHLDHNACADPAVAESCEWLVTNGLGSFASGTVAGVLTRRYHGLLIAALEPPRKRTLLVTKFDEIATINGQSFALGANRWAGGAVDPQGYHFLDSFRLEATVPVWSYAFPGAIIEKRLWMQHGANTTCVEYRCIDAKSPVSLAVKILVNYRDMHGATHAGEWRMQVEPFGLHGGSARGLRVVAYEGATPFYLLSATANAQVANVWYRNYDLAAERERGLDASEDHLHAGTLQFNLKMGERAAIVLTTDAKASLDAAPSFQAEQARSAGLLSRWKSAQPRKSTKPAAAPPWISQLVLAAGQFVLDARSPTDETPAIIAGYPWFGVWSRDTMIALPGLLLATGRAEIARTILQKFGGLVNQGMLPNFFPEQGQAPEYNTVDAALWFIAAVRKYLDSTNDAPFAHEIFPTLLEIVSGYSRGTRFGIHADPADGLLFEGEPGTQLTWMDARVAGRAVTPRAGKPVEVNALWVRALRVVAELGAQMGEPQPEAAALGDRAAKSFQRFWNPARNCCFDVLDGPSGNDPTLRPNQIFAVSIPADVLTADQQRAVVDACAKNLLTPFGLRSLAPGEPGYSPHYSGSQDERDAAYHQGVVWGWLLGPFALAHLRVYRDPTAALRLFNGIADHLSEAGLGTVSEIFDGEPPFARRGCPAQAWSVAAILQAWTALNPAVGRARKSG